MSGSKHSRKGPGQGRCGRAAQGRKGGPPRSRGAGRTGKVGAGDAPKRRSDKRLGGEQIEGRQAVRELLLAHRRPVHEIWISSELEGTDAVDDIEAIARANRVPISHVARKRLESTARSKAPQGVLAHAAELPEADLATLLRRRKGVAPFLVALDGVTDPGNLGAIVRTCDGAGADGIVVPRHRAVHVTPTVAKASAGAIEHVPIAVVAGLPNALQRMRDAGSGWSVSTTPPIGACSSSATSPRWVSAWCSVRKARGLSRLVRERCDLVVAIPMLGALSSLNVAAAAALTTYEVARRRARPGGTAR